MYIVAYDLEDDKERTSAIKVIEQFGVRIQKSVWLCDVSSESKSKLCNKLSELALETGVIDIWETHSESIRLGEAEDKSIWQNCHMI